MRALWLSWLALLPLAVLNVRRWYVVRRLREEERLARNEFLTFVSNVRGENTRAIYDSAKKRTAFACAAPLWRWTP